MHKYDKAKKRNKLRFAVYTNKKKEGKKKNRIRKGQLLSATQNFVR